MKSINYIGSTHDIKQRTQQHKKNCWNKNSKAYNYFVYQHIRKKNIDIELEILGVYKRECVYRIKLLVEQYYINLHDSVNNGLNTINTFRNEKNKNIYEKEWREKNRDYLLKEKKKDYIKNKEHYNKLKKIWYENNKEKVKKYAKQYQQQNREKYNEMSRKSYQKNKHKRSIKIKCPKCNCLIRKDGLKTHQKSKKCKTMALKCTDVFVCEI